MNDFVNKLHTTELGKMRIKKNLDISVNDVVEFLKNKILSKECVMYQNGKNYYFEIENIRITINSYNYCIITAHYIKR